MAAEHDADRRYAAPLRAIGDDAGRENADHEGDRHPQEMPRHFMPRQIPSHRETTGLPKARARRSARPAVSASKGTIRQNNGNPRMRNNWRNCVASGTGVTSLSRFGTARKMKIAQASVSPAKTKKAEPPADQADENSVGSVANTMPIAPVAMIDALTSERRSAGTHSEEAL